MFEVGKTYVENKPYRAPELVGVLKVEWIGETPDKIATLLFGFVTTLYPGKDWNLHLVTLKSPEVELTEDKFQQDWIEAEWDAENNRWRAATPKAPEFKAEAAEE